MGRWTKDMLFAEYHVIQGSKRHSVPLPQSIPQLATSIFQKVHLTAVAKSMEGLMLKNNAASSK